MKILTQDRERLIDTVGADIFVKEDVCGSFSLILEKSKKQYCLGAYDKHEHALKELKLLLGAIKVGGRSFEMRGAGYYVSRD